MTITMKMKMVMTFGRETEKEAEKERRAEFVQLVPKDLQLQPSLHFVQWVKAQF